MQAVPPLTPDFVPPLSHASGERGNHERAVFHPLLPACVGEGERGVEGSLIRLRQLSGFEPFTERGGRLRRVLLSSMRSGEALEVKFGQFCTIYPIPIITT